MIASNTTHYEETWRFGDADRFVRVWRNEASASSDSSPNLVSALIKLENSRDTQELMRALDDLIAWLQQDSPDYRRLRRTFTVWLAKSLLPARFPGVELPGLHSLSEVQDMLAHRVTEWTKQWEQQGIEKGLEQGIEQGLEQGLEQGIEQGIEKAKYEDAKNMLKEGIDVDVVARVTGLPKDKIESL